MRQGLYVLEQNSTPKTLLLIRFYLGHYYSNGIGNKFGYFIKYPKGHFEPIVFIVLIEEKIQTREVLSTMPVNWFASGAIFPNL